MWYPSWSASPSAWFVVAAIIIIVTSEREKYWPASLYLSFVKGVISRSAHRCLSRTTDLQVLVSCLEHSIALQACNNTSDRKHADSILEKYVTEIVMSIVTTFFSSPFSDQSTTLQVRNTDAGHSRCAWAVAVGRVWQWAAVREPFCKAFRQDAFLSLEGPLAKDAPENVFLSQMILLVVDFFPLRCLFLPLQSYWFLPSNLRRRRSSFQTGASMLLALFKNAFGDLDSNSQVCA